MIASKFAYCYEADGLMWCLHHNGRWARPFPATRREDTDKDENDDKESAVTSKK